MTVFALAVGGFIGTLLRYGLGESMPTLTNGFPVGVLAVNLVGCLVVGWFFTAAEVRWTLRPEVRLGFGVGTIGAFTTFSAFSVQTVELIQDGRLAIAALYVLLSALGGLLLAYAGVCLAKVKKKEVTR
ncbi:fluoride efflux transporter CrcB [Paenibacillus xerothermodurans]|uniref:Fluoride-specific ion channel FluC n=1 Tax=Paenibacillus xerothermodurans TaxID=1977292 RepID=A0A2W1NZE3_PAEXE|nr:fluoride efflux transporter CrcB [Paenibacillus xerothermodurans]PZE20892.1 fluoride efflux transporter CrcB [Paenibacillus xerothermodurans]